MLLTGIPLAKSHESSYNIYRRFGIYNRHLSSQQATRQLHDYINSPEYTISYLRGHRKTAILLANERRRKEYGYDTCASPELNPGYKAIYNCPICARKCFHCDLYQLSWLTECPIHHVPLTKQCPGCLNDWPMPFEFRDRHCSICGIGIEDSLLSERSAHEDFTNDSPLDSIQSLLDKYQNFNKGYIYSGYSYRRYFCEASTITNDDKYFPAFISSLIPGSKKLFDGLSIPIEKSNKVSFDNVCPSRKNSDYHFSTHVRILTKRNIKITKATIVRQLKKFFGGSYQPQLLESHELNEIKKTYDVISAALTTWHQLLNFPYHSKKPYGLLFGDSIYEYCGLGRRPVIPIIKPYMKIYSKAAPVSYKGFDYITPLYILPDNIISYIYRLELIEFFIKLLITIDHLKYVISNNYDRSTFFQSLHKRASPLSECEFPIGLFLSNKQKLIVITPKKHALLDIKRLPLHKNTLAI